MKAIACDSVAHALAAGRRRRRRRCRGGPPPLLSACRDPARRGLLARRCVGLRSARAACCCAWPWRLLLAVAALLRRGSAAARRRSVRALSGAGRRIAAAVGRRDRHADQLLDVAQKRPLLGLAERDRHPVGAGAGGAADAMHVALRNVRQVVVDHVADALDVDAARRDVGRDQRAHASGAEGGEHALALALRLVAVDRLGGEPGLGQRADHLVGAALGAGEDQRAVDRLLPQDFREQRRLAGAIDVDEPLLDALDGGRRRRHRDPDRVAQHLVGEIGDLLRHGRREEQRLALARQLGHDPADVVDEAHVEHAVGFVEHEDLDAIEADGAALHEVEQASGRRHQDVDAAGERADLAVDRDAADGERHAADADSGRRSGSCRRSAPRARGSGSAPARGRCALPAAGGSAERWLRIGSANAAVLPVPVCAMPTTSRAASTCGMVCSLDRRRGGVLLVDERAGDRFSKAEIEKRGQCRNFSCGETRAGAE